MTNVSHFISYHYFVNLHVAVAGLKISFKKLFFTNYYVWLELDR